MAAADYYLCDVCGQKAVYDADWHHRVDHKEGGFSGTGWHGDMRIICDDCAKSHRVIVLNRDTDIEDFNIYDATREFTRELP